MNAPSHTPTPAPQELRDLLKEFTRILRHVAVCQYSTTIWESAIGDKTSSSTNLENQKLYADEIRVKVENAIEAYTHDQARLYLESIRIYLPVYSKDKVKEAVSNNHPDGWPGFVRAIRAAEAWWRFEIGS